MEQRPPDTATQHDTNVNPLFVLRATIDAFVRHAYAQVAGLAIFSGVLFIISVAVTWLGRIKEK